MKANGPAGEARASGRTPLWARYSCRRKYSALIAILAILECGLVPQQQIGFFCNDPKISFKFTGDTISVVVLLGASVVIPIAVMWIAEYTCHAADSYDTVVGRAGSRVKQVWCWYGHYASGFVTLALICDIMKVLVGEPRPHFLETCRPREAHNCTDGYIGSYTCTNTDDSEWFVSDSSKSFPSGHSALSVYTSIFLTSYLQQRLPNRTLFVKPWLQCMTCLWAVTCSLSRIGDNRHHWWDVLAGIALGIAFSLFIVTIVCRRFHLEKGCAPRNLGDPLENDQIGFGGKQHQSIKKLLNNASVEMSEGRELRDISSPWKE